MEGFGKFCLVVMTLVLSMMINGFVLVTLYDWFIIPIFKAPAITLIEAMGVFLLVKFLFPGQKTDEDDKIFSFEKYWSSFCSLMAKAAIFLVLGMIVEKII